MRAKWRKKRMRRLKRKRRKMRARSKVGKILYKPSYTFKYEAVNLSCINLNKLYSTDDKSEEIFNLENKEQDVDHNLAVGVKPGYQVFRDDDSDIIFDVDEEKKRLDLAAINAREETIDPYEGLNMKHGVRGVFDIEDLVEILRKDKAQNIFVATVPSELSYVDYIVIVTAKSARHMSALATYIRKAYKLKRYPEELLPKIEGKNSKDWVAIDLGNIALHIFTTTIREKYDLETLWSVGPTYDKIINTPDHDIEFQESYSDYLAGFQPADENVSISKPDVLQ
ncbi:hypothetical protein PV327_006025 [Microctonus hyperodae]|nr:hypothetical protein PV327_006025 [Microctonus hyperodae]